MNASWRPTVRTVLAEIPCTLLARSTVADTRSPIVPDADSSGLNRRSTRASSSSDAVQGSPHGQNVAQDPRGLPLLPRDHPPRATHRAHGVDHWRASCRKVPAGFGGEPRGKGPAQRAPLRAAYPVSQGWKAQDKTGYRGDFGFSAAAAITIAITVMINGRAGT
jgi:hypothetical protein